jgi:hypothetical protein
LTFTINKPLPSYHALERLVEKCYIKGKGLRYKLVVKIDLERVKLNPIN